MMTLVRLAAREPRIVSELWPPQLGQSCEPSRFSLPSFFLTV